MNMLAEPVLVDTAELRLHAGRACNLLKAMANEDRMLLLCQIASAPAQVGLNVGELEMLTGIRQPTLSQQLGVLRQEQLVNTQKKGKFVYYRLASDEVIHIMCALRDIYCPNPAPTSAATSLP